jgi:hypothetical protein
MMGVDLNEGRNGTMIETRTFERGTPTRCNVCDEVSPFPKARGKAMRENSRAWRLQTMAVLECGHMDAHWVYDQDLVIA